MVKKNIYPHTNSPCEFIAKLENLWVKNNSCACVGLDPDYTKIPQYVKNLAARNSKNRHKSIYSSIILFNRLIIDATYDLVCAYKLNAAFYEAYGVDGILALKDTIKYIKKNYPDIPIILDSKKADIDNTNLGYIDSSFKYLKADAITLHPYLGIEALKPFLEQKDKGIFILIHTSNNGSSEFQDITVSETGEKLYQYIAKNTYEKWNYNNNCAVVVGATYPLQLSLVRSIVKDMPILIPGIGAQGGSIKEAVVEGKDSTNKGMIISSSRNIIYSYKENLNGKTYEEKDFDKAARGMTQSLKNQINQFRV